MKVMTKLSQIGVVAAVLAVVAALFSLILLFWTALVQHARKARAEGGSLAAQIVSIRSWLAAGAGWLDAFVMGARSRFVPIAGGMSLWVKPSDQVTLLERISPVSQGVGTVTTGFVSAADFEALMATIQTGVLGAAATVDAKLEQATTSGGAGVKNVTGSAITQLVKASNDNNEVVINCQDEQLDTNGGFIWVRLSITVGVAASLISAQLYGVGARYQAKTHKATMVQAVQVRA